MSPVWERYADTVLQFPDGGLSLDLRLPLPRSTPQRLAELGLPGSFAVVTACNPLGTLLDAAANQRLTAVFDQVVRERFPAARRATGSSPDGSHQEVGWAIPGPLAALQLLAQEFLQNALFWFDGAGFSIVPVLAPGPPLALPASRSAH
ncbi:MAG TPA: DUF3293 domain-containing protein [Gemmatimonadales bacterium]